jgi:hypothetical protein
VSSCSFLVHTVCAVAIIPIRSPVVTRCLTTKKKYEMTLTYLYALISVLVPLLTIVVIAVDKYSPSVVRFCGNCPCERTDTNRTNATADTGQTAQEHATHPDSTPQHQQSAEPSRPPRTEQPGMIRPSRTQRKHHSHRLASFSFLGLEPRPNCHE